MFKALKALFKTQTKPVTDEKKQISSYKYLVDAKITGNITMTHYMMNINSNFDNI
jgi:hypothetical protein